MYPTISSIIAPQNPAGFTSRRSRINHTLLSFFNEQTWNWWVKTIFLNLLTQEKEPEKNCGTKYGGEDVDGDVAVGEESLADLGDVILGEEVACLLCHQLAQPLHHPQQQVCHCLAL